jgi:acyl transferase domain-containing protein
MVHNSRGAWAKVGAGVWPGLWVQNLRRMVQFVQAFSNAEIVATLSRQLNWNHFVAAYPFKD